MFAIFFVIGLLIWGVIYIFFVLPGKVFGAIIEGGNNLLKSLEDFWDEHGNEIGKAIVSFFAATILLTVISMVVIILIFAALFKVIGMIFEGLLTNPWLLKWLSKMAEKYKGDPLGEAAEQIRNEIISYRENLKKKKEEQQRKEQGTAPTEIILPTISLPEPGPKLKQTKQLVPAKRKRKTQKSGVRGGI